MEKEEAQALVAALEQSNLQQGHLPYVPGLSKEKDDETLTIHIQDEVRILIFLVNFGNFKSGGKQATIMLFWSFCFQLLSNSSVQ